MLKQPVMTQVHRAAWMVLVVLLVLASVYSWRAWGDAQQNLQAENQKLLRLGASTLNASLKQLEVSLQGLSKYLADERNLADPLALHDQLLNFQNTHPFLSGLGVIDLKGQIRASPTLGRTGKLPSRSDSPVFLAFKEKMRQGEGFLMHRPVLSQFSNRWVVSVGVPVKNLQGHYAAIVVATLPVNLLESYWKPVLSDSETQVGLQSDEGYLLSRYAAEQSNKLEQIFGQPRTGALRQFLLANKFPVSGQAKGLGSLGETGTTHLYDFQRLENFPATLYLRTPQAELWSRWAAIVLPSYLAITGLLLGGWLSLLWLNRRLQRVFVERRQDAEAQEHLASIVESTDDAIISQSSQGVVLSWNAGAENLLGYSAADMLGQNWFKLVPENALKEEIRYLERVVQGEVIKRKQTQRIAQSGQLVELETSYNPIRSEQGQVTAISCVMRDNRWRKTHEAEIKRLADYDSLTGLPNRRLLKERFEQSWDAALTSQEFGAMIFLDLDHFKIINDTKGHAVGDLVLQEMSKRLTGLLRASDSVARFGGDEFVVLLTGLSRNQQHAVNNARTMALAIQSELSRPLDFMPHSLGVSLGVSLFPQSGQAQDDVMREADTAMYSAKASGRHLVAFFEPSMHSKTAQRLKLLQELESALPAGEFELFVQTQHDAAGAIQGAELLLRWNHPTRGLLSPAEFMAVVETSNVIFPLGDWVLEQGIR
ncbi:MAG: diguanylate cyclase, partial [Burkholderiaceae bacterium]